MGFFYTKGMVELKKIETMSFKVIVFSTTTCTCILASIVKI